MVNVALVGCAHIHTPGFIKRIRDRPDIRAVAVYDSHRARAERHASELGARATDDLSTIWRDDSVAGVIICSETDRHEELVEAAVAARRHVFVEKPLGFSAKDAERIASLIESAGVIFQTGYFQRGIPAHLFIRDHIQAGTFGGISRIRISNCHSGVMRDLFSPDWLWMTNPKRAGVGAFGDMGAHALDLMIWMLGPVESVTASLGRVSGRYGDACDETGEALLRFKRGVIGSIAAGWVDLANPITLEISGTQGHAYVKNRNDVYISSAKLRSDGATAWPDLPVGWPHALELFFDVLNGKHAPLVTASEAAYRNEVMERIYEAAAAKRWVDVPE